MSKTYTAIFPSYMKEFQCIGPECTDNCCIGWRVDLDRKTFHRYRDNSSAGENLKELFSKNIARNRKVNTDRSYGTIKMDESKVCPFLSGEKLCQIQLAMGHEALSETCQTYPRGHFRVGGRLLYYATLSCPEIARKALLAPDGIMFMSESMEFDETFPYQALPEYNAKDKNRHVINFYFDIMSAAINLLQCRDFSLEERMILLASFSSNIGNNAGEPEQIEKIIDQYDNLTYLQSYIGSFSVIEPRYLAQIKLLSEWEKLMFSYRSDFSGEDRFYMENLLEAVKGIYIEGGLTEKEMADRYKDKGVVKYKEFMEKNSYILENYLVNTLFEDRFPLSYRYKMDGEVDVFLSFMVLAAKFNLLRTLIIGLLLNEREIDEEYLIRLIQSFSKKTHHNTEKITKLIDNVRENNTYSLAGAVITLNI